MKQISLVAIILLMVSCKPKQILAETTASNPKNTIETVIENYNNNKMDFSTLYIKANAKYEDEKNTQNVNAEIKIKNNEKILISIRILGITMAKALITPDKVQYYEKINNTYFEGDYATLSNWIGTNLDYQKVQNLFLGKTFENLNKEQFIVNMFSNMYQISQALTSADNVSTYYLTSDFLLAKQQFEQRIKNRNFNADYSNYKEYQSIKLPNTINITATNGKEATTTIDINYKTVTLNEDLSFPYSVPEGYEQININKN